MSNFTVATMKKMRGENLNGLTIHNQRKTDNHSNKDIDVTKSNLNYDLINDRPISYKQKINRHISLKRTSTRKLRKDAVVLAEWIVSASPDFFKNLRDEDTKKYFKTCVNFFESKFGQENIMYAQVHLDERTPHMHMGIVPMTEDNRLSAKDVFKRTTLREIQNELPKFLQQNGFEVVRGKKDSERKKLTVAEYKQLQDEIKELKQIKDGLKEKILLELNEERMQLQYEQHVAELELNEKKEHAANTIKAVLGKYNSVPKEDEPVYFFSGESKPIFMGSVKDVVEEDNDKLQDKVETEMIKDNIFDKTPEESKERYSNFFENLKKRWDLWKQELKNYIQNKSDERILSCPIREEKYYKLLFINPIKKDFMENEVFMKLGQSQNFYEICDYLFKEFKSLKMGKKITQGYINKIRDKGINR